MRSGCWLSTTVMTDAASDEAVDLVRIATAAQRAEHEARATDRKDSHVSTMPIMRTSSQLAIVSCVFTRATSLAAS